MKRAFLASMNIEKEMINKIMREHGKSMHKLRKQLFDLEAECRELKANNDKSLKEIAGEIKKELALKLLQEND